MNRKKFLAMSLTAVLLVSVIAFAFPSGNAAAQSPTPQPNDPQSKLNIIDARLQRMLRLEKATLARMRRNFERLDRFITRVDALIIKAKNNGKDVAALEAAVAEFQARESEARVVLDSATSLLAAHPGFDANGKVTDRETARKTLEEGHKQFKEIRSTIGEAAKDLHEAVKAWREANPAEPAP